jgi:hypothetical protein
MRVGVGDCCAKALEASTETTASEATSERGSHEEIFGMIFPQRFRSEQKEYPAKPGIFRHGGS